MQSEQAWPVWAFGVLGCTAWCKSPGRQLHFRERPVQETLFVVFAGCFWAGLLERRGSVQDDPAVGRGFQLASGDSSSKHRQAASLRLPLHGTLSAGWWSVAGQPRQWLCLMSTSGPRSKYLTRSMPCAAGQALWACTRSLDLQPTLRASRAW